MTPLIRKRVDRARASHGFAAWLLHDAPSQAWLGRGGVSPIEGTALQRGPLRRTFNGWKVRGPAGLDDEHSTPSAAKPIREHTACRARTHDDVVIHGTKLFRRRKNANTRRGPP